MSIITKIDSLPLFTKKAEALKYARLNGLSGYHEHTYFGKKGYMAGRTHSEIPRATTFITEKTIDMSTVKVQQGLYTTKQTAVIDETESTPQYIDTDTGTSGGGGYTGGGY